MTSKPPASDARPDLEIRRSGRDRRGATEPDRLGGHDRAPGDDNTLEEIRAELRAIKTLLTERSARVDDLVDASYIARRTGLAERTVKDGKAGTDQIPRVYLQSPNTSRALVRYPKGAADRFVSDLVSRAVANVPGRRALRLLKRKSPKGQKIA